MAAPKLCPACRGVLIPYKFAGHNKSEFRSLMDAFVCTDCRRIELYAPDDRFAESVKAEEDRVKKFSSKVEKLHLQLKDLKEELERCKAIAADENQTVKAVREAEARIKELSEEIRQVEGRILYYDCKY